MSSDLTQNAITVSQVSKHYLIYDRPQDRLKQFLFRGARNYYRDFHALRNVSLEVGRGETVGIVGRNGSGKSTLLQIVCGTVQPSSGSIDVHGRISALLELGAGFNPEFSGKENIFLNGAILGLTESEIEQKYDGIIAFSGLDEAHIRQPVKTYSSGMYVRLAFSVAVASDPDILVVDEALAVGDEAFQRKCFARIKNIQERGGTILFVSHAAQTVVELCNRAIMLDGGELIADGEPKRVIEGYRKLVHAPAAQQQAIRDAIHHGEEWQPEEQDSSASLTDAAVEYASHGVRIENPRVMSLDGAPATVLHQHEEYHYSYDVVFEQDASDVRCGMMIKTKSGIELGGSSLSASPNDPEATISAGTKLSLSFRFRPALAASSYFLNCGCSGIPAGGQHRVFLHRITDAAMFEVLPEAQQTQTGIVDFHIAPSVKHHGSSASSLHFLGIGAQKSGTTWLYHNLARHPRISFPAGKEIHFWDRANSLDEPAIDHYHRMFNVTDHAVHGDITPAYAILPPERIQAIRETFPDLRLIYLLRDPRERAWSSALMALRRAEMTPEETSDAWFIDHFRSAGSRQRGDYETCLRHWLEVFPREQVLIRPYEQIISDPAELLKACSSHLGVAPDFFDTIALSELQEKVYAGQSVPIRNSLKTELSQLYDARIESLKHYLKEIDAFKPEW